jgi:hypothetical protein
MPTEEQIKQYIRVNKELKTEISKIIEKAQNDIEYYEEYEIVIDSLKIIFGTIISIPTTDENFREIINQTFGTLTKFLEYQESNTARVAEERYQIKRTLILLLKHKVDRKRAV